MTHEEYLEEISSSILQEKLRGFIASKVYGHHNIEDILQTTNKTLIEKFPSYKHNGKINSWATTIAYWTIKGWKKKHANAKVIFDDEVFWGRSNTSDFSFFDARDEEEKFEFLRTKLTFVLSQATPKSRAIFESYMNGDKPGQIGKDTGYPMPIIYKTIQRVKNRLKDILLKCNRED